MILEKAAAMTPWRTTALAGGRPTTSSNAGAGASSGGDSLSGVLRFPRPGEAHRTVYRADPDVSGDLGEPFSLDQHPFASARSCRAAVLNAHLKGEATSGGQTSDARMTEPRPFGALCLIHTLPDPNRKSHRCDFDAITVT
jgi:hypothetical protein